ncbi:MAG: HNH endonuclease [Endomicrobiaceae bacterium]|nr:HNH endonuclease [Endomicrobiaceae bacterium]
MDSIKCNTFDSLTIGEIIHNVLGNDLNTGDDVYDYIDNLEDALFKLYFPYWEKLVRTECGVIRGRYKNLSTKCDICGIMTDKIEIHHIISPKRGGGNDRANLQFLCHKCHTDTYGKKKKESAEDGY